GDPPPPRPPRGGGPGGDAGAAARGGGQARQRPFAAARLRDAPAGGRLRPADGAGAARPRKHRDDDGVRARVEPLAAGCPEPGGCPEAHISQMKLSFRHDICANTLENAAFPTTSCRNDRGTPWVTPPRPPPHAPPDF